MADIVLEEPPRPTLEEIEQELIRLLYGGTSTPIARVFRMNERELLECTQTVKPAVPPTLLLRSVERGTGRYAVLYDDHGAPASIWFGGRSGA